MENTQISKEKSESAIYFKHRLQIDCFTSPVADDSPFGVRRQWVNPKTMEKGSTNEMQLSKIEGKWCDARIHTQEWPKSETQPARKETSLLLALKDDVGLVKVLKLDVFGKKSGISRAFSGFARKCEGIDIDKYTSFESWMPTGSEYAVLMFKQPVEGKKWPQSVPCNYWNKEKEAYEGLPEVIITEGLGGTKDYNSKDRDNYLYGLVESFCKKVQDNEKNKEAEEGLPNSSPAHEIAPADDDVDFG